MFCDLDARVCSDGSCGGGVLVSTAALELLDIQESALEEVSDDARDECKEGKSFESVLEVGLVDASGGVETRPAIVVVLSREDESCQPEVGEDPC